MSRQLAAQVVQVATGEMASNVAVLTGGQVGRVYRVDTPSGPLVVKFVTASDEPAFADEPPDNRVYGARWSNLGPAHEALTAGGFRTPVLYATGDLDAEGLRYAVMEYLDGDADDHSAAWFATVGRALGQVHGVTRIYQGWVGLEAPLADDWAAAFGKSLRNRLREAGPLLGRDLHEAIAARAGEQLRHLQDPPTFVLSHTDGFQGVLRRSGDGWACVGHIDIEDFQFTDQRFVLAGFELSHALAGRSVPPDFWDAYLEAVDLAPGYRRIRDLFQTYYLLVWAWVLKDQAVFFEACVRRLQAIAG
jgi:Ser/Thr protein kinase RdoA (MazF antagonist)